MSIVRPDLNSTVKWSAKTAIFSMSFLTYKKELERYGFKIGKINLKLPIAYFAVGFLNFM
jgi:hypothetical protein